jgi:hypothetical protein
MSTRSKMPTILPSSSGALAGADLSTALGATRALGRPVERRQKELSREQDQKIVNMLADDTAAPAAARTLAKAAEQEGKLISDYLTERLQLDHAPPMSAWDKMKAAAAEARERRQAKDEKFVPTEPRPTYKEPREVTAMVLAYRDQIKFLDRLKLVVNAMKGLPPDTNFAQALAAALTEGARALKALEKEQEPIIAAGIAASKASAEAYAIAFKAWEARMEPERARSEKARREKL